LGYFFSRLKEQRSIKSMIEMIVLQNSINNFIHDNLKSWLTRCNRCSAASCFTSVKLKIAARSCRSNAQNLEINLSLTICDVMPRAYLCSTVPWCGLFDARS